MQTFLALLRTQRWDDHRFYHHSRANQSLHLLSALAFLAAYVIAFKSLAVAALIAWSIAMTSRQAGHFFFEPRGYDEVNHATHEHKEAIKVGYNLRRKVVLMSIWVLSPLILLVFPDLFRADASAAGTSAVIHQVGTIWFAVGLGGLVFRTVQLFILQDVQTGLVWFTKIATDPFHDVMLYYKAPVMLFRERALRPLKRRQVT